MNMDKKTSYQAKGTPAIRNKLSEKQEQKSSAKSGNAGESGRKISSSSGKLAPV